MKENMFIALTALILITACSSGTDWPGFRGPGAAGVSNEKNIAVEWSDTRNLAWKTPMPGHGSSCPIVLDNKVYITCYSGYGLDKDNHGDQKNLKRHLLCVNAANGRIIWNKTVDAILPEDPYEKMIQEHGYASQSPVTDGKNIYVFFGKTGVIAFDLDGRQIWQRSVGTQSDKMKWGSATSPVLYKDLVIVNAWDESKTLYALNKNNGQPVWKRDLSGTGLTFSTPVIAENSNQKPELLISLPAQLWGLNPETGQTIWTVNTNINDSMIPTPVVVDSIAYIHGGGPRSSGSLAVRIGGKGDVTKTHVLWSSKNVTSPPSPVITDGLIFWVDGYGRACCAETETGKLIYKEKLPVSEKYTMYASVVAAESRIYAVTRKDGTYVIDAKPDFRILAHNTFASDDSDFNASPAISNKCLFLRSDKFLYCIKSIR